MPTKPKILIILGPTAVGKSDLAVELALEFNGEIVSADSRQVYTGLNIGTGKITTEEMRGIPHHMLDVVDPSQRFSVIDYVKQAERAITDILSRNKLPIICGGTGFYIQALIDGTLFPDIGPNPELQKELAGKSVIELASILKKLDPAKLSSMNESDSKNPRRLIRAIEIATALGSVPPHTPDKHVSLYEPLFIGLNVEAELLKERIRARLLKRIDVGMVEEIKNLHATGLSWERMDELGLEYRYIARFLQNQMNKGDIIRVLHTQIWHYAKRQMTWFKKDTRIKWFTPDQKQDITNAVKTFLT
ncbi:MAG: tRNA (adenosine(37)-N6)-dimethylallyltransferase MiaA [Candidatus Taylorbacteria bacterium]